MVPFVLVHYFLGYNQGLVLLGEFLFFYNVFVFHDELSFLLLGTLVSQLEIAFGVQVLVDFVDFKLL